MQSSKDMSQAILEAIKEARSLPKISLDGELVITYTWRAKPAALSMYMTLLHSGLKATIAHTALASVHIIPYRDIDTLVVFTADERDTRTVNLAMAASSLGIRTTVVGPRMHPAIEDTLNNMNVERIEVSSNAPVLTMMIASLFWRPKLMGAREERMQEELTSLDSAYEWIRERYSEEIAKLSQIGPEKIYYTPSIEAGASYYAMLAGANSYPLDELSNLKGPREAIAFVAGVDQHNYKDIILNASLRGVKLYKVVIDTDPVTVNLYAAMLAIAALNKLL
ncbi:MAG: hypothetical protein GXO68_02750 [Crenarchaeota archaeon]|nr:hypothetical protein [Thermoproteota archaeon]